MCPCHGVHGARGLQLTAGRAEWPVTGMAIMARLSTGGTSLSLRTASYSASSSPCCRRRSVCTGAGPRDGIGRGLGGNDPVPGHAASPLTGIPLADLHSQLYDLAAKSDYGYIYDHAADARIWAIVAEMRARAPRIDYSPSLSGPARVAFGANINDGAWRGLYSTMMADLKLSRETTLARQTFDVLPPVAVTVERTIQVVDTATSRYINYIYWRAGSLLGVAEIGAHVTVTPECPQRLEIVFDRCRAYARGSVPDDPEGQAYLRRYLRLPESTPLEGELPHFVGWTEAVYYDGAMRVSVGNRGNTFVVLKRRPGEYLSFDE